MAETAVEAIFMLREEGAFATLWTGGCTLYLAAAHLVFRPSLGWHFIFWLGFLGHLVHLLLSSLSS